MLPAPMLMFKMDELNSVNGSTSFQYDESVILNCVRNRKKVTELPNCPVCSCTIRHGELESHLALEVERLQKISSGASKRKLSANGQSPQNLAIPGTSADCDEDIDLSGFTGSDVYQRVHENRVRRLRARRRNSPAPASQHGECPVCNVKVPVSKIQRHALRCLKRTGAEVDDDVPDTSSEGSIDVENDEPETSGFGAEYQWCGQWRGGAPAPPDAPGRAPPGPPPPPTPRDRWTARPTNGVVSLVTTLLVQHSCDCPLRGAACRTKSFHRNFLHDSLNVYIPNLEQSKCYRSPGSTTACRGGD